MAFFHKDSDPNLKSLYPRIHNESGSYSYKGRTYDSWGFPSPVEPMPQDTVDELAQDAADWCIAPVHPSNSVEFTETKQSAYIEHVAKTGTLREGAAVLGVSYRDIEKERRTNREFDELVSEALELYSERVQRSLSSRGMYGWLEKQYAQNGAVLGFKRKYDNRLLLSEARRVNPNYRESPKFAMQQNFDRPQSSGVLVVKERPKTIEEWEQKY